MHNTRVSNIKTINIIKDNENSPDENAIFHLKNILNSKKKKKREKSQKIILNSTVENGNFTINFKVEIKTEQVAYEFSREFYHVFFNEKR